MSTITARPTVSTVSPRTVANAALDRLATFLTAHSITILRVSLGLVFLVFASFKFVSGASPAEDLAVATVGKLTFGMVTRHRGPAVHRPHRDGHRPHAADRSLRQGRPGRHGRRHGRDPVPAGAVPRPDVGRQRPDPPGQYVFKDIVLVAGALVVAAHALGARLRRS